MKFIVEWLLVLILSGFALTIWAFAIFVRNEIVIYIKKISK